MRTTLIALSVGVAMLGGVGSAYAADVATPTDSQVVILTDTQMAGITAGHLVYPPENLHKEHKGWYWKKVDRPFWPDTWKEVYGKHIGCGARRCGER